MKTVVKIAKGTGIVFSGKAINSLLFMVTAVLVARVLGVDNFGLYSFVFAYLTFFNVIADMGIKTILVREISKGKIEVAKLLGNAIIMRITLSLLALLLACFVVSFLNYPLSTKILVYIASLSFFTSLTLFYESVFQANHKMGYIVGVNILDSLIKIVIFCVLVFSKAKLILYIVASVVAPIPGLFIIIRLSKKFIRPKFKLDFKICKDLIKESWPLALTAAFIVLYVRIDQLMLFQMKGAESVGYYAAAVRLTEAFNILPAAFMMAVFPLFSKYFISSKKKLEKAYNFSFRYMAMVIIPIAVGISILSEPIINILYGGKFLGSVPALRILIWSGIFSFLGTVHLNLLIAVGLQKLDFIFTSSGAAANILLNLFLIPRYGIVGAAIATVVAYSLGVPLSCLLLKTRKYGLALVRSTLKPFIAAIIMGCFTYWAFSLGFGLLLVIPISMLLYLLVIILVKGFDIEDKKYFRQIVFGA
ncbi:MAG: flippase [Candidatus Omnitrophica bacterium]|nr:flippase [Candidatus Omnitrophota bacterium]